jgi:hypothetical protein
MSDSQKTQLEGRLLGTGKEASTVVWEALKSLKCAVCGSKIQIGELFTKIRSKPYCRNCRSFTT